jgi:hypothetical protein
LASKKSDALKILERHGHVIARKLAGISEAEERDAAPEMRKFFSSAAQASAKHAQGIVVNQNGFAVMKHGGQIHAD